MRRRTARPRIVTRVSARPARSAAASSSLVDARRSTDRFLRDYIRVIAIRYVALRCVTAPDPWGWRLISLGAFRMCSIGQ